MKCIRWNSTLALTDDFIKIITFFNARKFRSNPILLIRDTLRAQTVEILYLFCNNKMKLCLNLVKTLLRGRYSAGKKTFYFKPQIVSRWPQLSMFH